MLRVIDLIGDALTDDLELLIYPAGDGRVVLIVNQNGRCAVRVRLQGSPARDHPDTQTFVDIGEFGPGSPVPRCDTG